MGPPRPKKTNLARGWSQVHPLGFCHPLQDILAGYCIKKKNWGEFISIPVPSFWIAWDTCGVLRWQEGRERVVWGEYHFTVSGGVGMA